MLKLSEQNVILTANQFNLSIFSQLWLAENGIVDRDEFAGEAYFTPVAVNVGAPKFDLLIVSDRIQVTSRVHPRDSGSIFSRIAGGIADRLPHTPFTALGFNVHFLAEPSISGGLENSAGRLFLHLEGGLKEEFSSADSRFGLYLSKNILGTRLRVEVKPAREHPQGAEMLVLQMNFHREVTKPAQVQEALANWDACCAYATRIAGYLDERFA